MIYLYEQMHTLNWFKNCERLKAELNRGIYEINALKTQNIFDFVDTFT